MLRRLPLSSNNSRFAAAFAKYLFIRHLATAARRNHQKGKPMANDSRLLSKFRISDDNLEGDQPIYEAYNEYSSKRYEFREARTALNRAITTLHDLLDEPLRSAGLIPGDKDWTLREDDEEDG